MKQTIYLPLILVLSIPTLLLSPILCTAQDIKIEVDSGNNNTIHLVQKGNIPAQQKTEISVRHSDYARISSQQEINTQNKPNKEKSNNNNVNTDKPLKQIPQTHQEAQKFSTTLSIIASILTIVTIIM